MKLWMSGEVHVDVADAYREARQAVESAVNSKLSPDPAFPLEQWAVLAIILPPDWSDGYSEFQRYHRARRVFEARLALDFQAFHTASTSSRRGQLIELLVRSLALMGAVGALQPCAQELARVVASLASGDRPAA